MEHIIGAERLWLGRLTADATSTPIWPEWPLGRIDAELSEVVRTWEKYMSALDEPGLDASIGYVNSKGEEWRSVVRDVLYHVLTHSHYHRGQIASFLGRAGHTPAYTDYIHWVRQGLAQEAPRL
jgi:uncharacterized damage-inducible protein DinB